MNMNSSLHGWQDDDINENQRKLQELANRLSGKNRPQARQQEAQKPAEHPSIDPEKTVAPKHKET